MFRLISMILANDGTPHQVMDAIPWRKKPLFEVLDDELNAEQVRETITKDDVGGTVPRVRRFFLPRWRGLSYWRQDLRAQKAVGKKDLGGGTVAFRGISSPENQDQTERIDRPPLSDGHLHLCHFNESCLI